MKNFSIIIVLILSVNLFSQANPPETVKYVDLKKYSGTWYEIAKIPNSFQDHCIKGTTAEYRIDEDGEIIVINSCINEDGEKDVVDGVAQVVDKKTNAKLEVSFVSFLGWRPFWGDYWIIGLDDDYKWVIIGHPEREYGWILSRTKSIDEETVTKIYKILEEKGYKKSDFVMTKQ